MADALTDEKEAMRRADEQAGLKPSDAKIAAPADLVDLLHRAEQADESAADAAKKLAEGKAPGSPVTRAKSPAPKSTRKRTARKKS